jgi:hypothetical protein
MVRANRRSRVADDHGRGRVIERVWTVYRVAVVLVTSSFLVSSAR